MLEWYDFTVYALFAGYIAGNFFPGDDKNTRLLKTFLVFGLGFVVRPLGALLLLLLGRVLQGFSAGGEIGGATAYLLESAEPAQRGRVASWLEASMGMANILGALAAFSVTAVLSTSEVQAWGWRIPFIFGLAIAPVGLYLRRTLDETEAFQAETARRTREHAQGRVPLLEIFRNHGRS